MMSGRLLRFIAIAPCSLWEFCLVAEISATELQGDRFGGWDFAIPLHRH